MGLKGKKDTISRIEFVGILIVAIMLIYGILSRTGAIQSGFHFVDDHELVRMKVSFEQQGVSLWQGIWNWMRSDLHWRFRPFYWVERVICAYLWGGELLYWNYYTVVKGIITFCCLYFMARFLKYDRVISAIVPCVAMLGSHFTPWYRSANQESTGMMFGAITLCLIAAQAYYKKYTDWRYNIFIVLGGVICGLVKESFTLFMPTFVALKFWLEYWDEDNILKGKARWLKCVKSNAVTYGVLIFSMLINVCMIAFYVGVDKVSYAGFQESTPLSTYIYGIKTSITTYTRSYTIIAALIVLLIIVCYKNIEKKDICLYCSLALIGGVTCAIQLVGHAKSGMWERYIIPYIIGYIFVFILVAYRIFEKDVVHKLVFWGLMLILLYQNVPIAYSGAEGYAYTGKMTNLLLQTLKTETTEADQIVCAFQDEELNLSTESWMEASGRTQIYSWKDDKLQNLIQIVGTAPTEYSWENAKAIVCYTWQIEDILQLAQITQEKEYVQHDFAGYSIIIRSQG